MPTAIRTMRKMERPHEASVEMCRQRLGMELHDGLGQDLSGLAFLAQAVADGLKAAPNDPAALECLARDAERVARMSSQAIDTVRLLAQGLWPGTPAAKSLGPAICKLAADLNGIFGVHCEVAVEGEPERLSAQARHDLYRIAQEAAGNAIKHGQARNLYFRLAGEAEGFVMTIENDGKPLNQALLANRHGLGVASMRLRADALGAQFELGPATGARIGVRVRLPALETASLPQASD